MECFINLFRKHEEISPLSLPDDEFMFIDKISKIKNMKPSEESDILIENLDLDTIKID